MITQLSKNRKLFVKLLKNNDFKKNSKIVKMTPQRDRLIYWFARQLSENQTNKHEFHSSKKIYEQLEIKKDNYDRLVRGMSSLFYRDGTQRAKGSHREWKLTQSVIDELNGIPYVEPIKVPPVVEPIKKEAIVENELVDEDIFDDDSATLPDVVTPDVDWERWDSITKIEKFNDDWEQGFIEECDETEHRNAQRSENISPLSWYLYTAFDYAGVDYECSNGYMSINDNLRQAIGDDYTYTYVKDIVIKYIKSHVTKSLVSQQMGIFARFIYRDRELGDFGGFQTGHVSQKYAEKSSSDADTYYSQAKSHDYQLEQAQAYYAMGAQQ